jgi:hypothetical protein
MHNQLAEVAIGVAEAIELASQVVDVEAKLSRILRLKCPHLETDGDEASQPTMERKQRIFLPTLR